MLSQQIQRNISLLQNMSLKAWPQIAIHLLVYDKQQSKNLQTIPTLVPKTVSLLGCLTMFILCSVCSASPAFSSVAVDQKPAPNTEGIDSSFEDNFCTNAKEKYEKTLTKIESDESIGVISQKLLMVAEENFQQGRVKDAINSLSKARRLLNLPQDKESQNQPSSEEKQTLKALIHGRLGTACMSLGHFEYSKKEMEEAIKIALTLGNLPMLGGFYNDLGNLHATEAMDLKDQVAFLKEQTVDDQLVGEDSEIIQTRQKAKNAFNHSVDAYNNAIIQAKMDPVSRRLSVRTHLNLAKANLLNAQYSQAYEYMTTAYNENRQLDDSTFKASGFSAIGTINTTLLKQFPKSSETFVQNAEYAFQEAIRIASILQDKRSYSHALGQWGYLLKETGQHEKSLKFTEQAGLLAQEIQAPDIMFKWGWQEGQLHKALGRLEEAENSYRRAKESLKKLPSFTPVGLKGRKTSFRAGRGQFFIELTDIYFQRALKDTPRRERQENGGESQIDNLIKARSTMEELKKAEIQDFYQDDCVEAYGKSLKLVDDILAKPPPQMDPLIIAAVLYPIVLPDRLELLLSLPNKKLKRLETGKEQVSEQRLKKEVIRFREAVQTRGEHTYREPGSQLFKWLISPALAELDQAKVNTLIIVPDGALRTIPLGALYNQGKETFLFEDFSIAIASGVQLPEPKPTQRDKLKVLSVGLSDDLPFVDQELTNLKSIFSGSIETLQNEKFTVETVTKKMEDEPFTIVHMATHGSFGESEAQSFLKTGDEKPVNMGRLREMMGLFKFRDVPLDLLTLSACDTAVGSDRAGLGLTGVALNAGARSVVATLWPVDDRATAEFINNFYQLLLDNPSISKAEALTRAQSTIKDHNFSEYRHPYYWAPFVLFNNWL